MNKHIYSDLAIDSLAPISTSENRSEEYFEEDFGIARLCRLDIRSEDQSRKYKRPPGSYVTVVTDKLWLMTEDQLNAVSDIVSDQLRSMVKALAKKEISKELSVLVVGLGNSEITSDAIGPLTVSHLTVTRHLSALDSAVFEGLGMCCISAISPGVLAQTGIETLETIRAVTSKVSPDIVIAVDALASRSCHRLGSTIQLSTDGINPGAGIGNLRKGINKETLGVPVIAVGVPTVVDSATLVYDALEQAGIEDSAGNLEQVLQNGRSFFVSPKECDAISRSVGILLGNAIDIALSIE